MPDRDQEEQTEQGQAQAAAAPEQAQDQAQAPGADASAVGNAAMEGRSGRSDALPPAPDATLAAQGPATPSTGAAVNDALVAVPFSGPTLVTTIAQWVRNGPAAGANLGRDVWIDALAGVLTGNEMAQVLHIIRFPAAGAGRVVHWIGAICKAHTAVAAASASTYTNVLMGASQADIAQLLQVGNDALLANLLARVPSDPLTLFPDTQAGLTADAAASARFVAEMIARASDAQIWRAVKGTAPAALPALAANLNAAVGGWGWLARLEAASFSAADRVLLTALHPTANADGQAKITAANAVVGVETPAVPFPTAFDTLKAAGLAPTAQALRTFMQTGSPAERVAVMTDAAKAA